MSINKYEFEWAKAIAKDDWRSIEQQIVLGLNVNRGPILHTAIQQKRFSIARKLIDNGADINKVNKKGKSPLQILIENHRLNPPRKTRRNNFRRRPTHLGAGDMQDASNQSRALEFGRYMLEKGANPIVGQNEGEDHELYQDFYKHKTKITRQEYEKLKGIINDEDLHRLEMELESNFTVQCVGPDDSECLNRGLLHLAVLAPSYKIIKALLDKGADPNYEDSDGATPLYMIFHPIKYKDRKKYTDDKQIPPQLLNWPNLRGGGKPRRNDELVRIGQALLQAGSRFVPDHTPDIDKVKVTKNYYNCPLMIFWHLYSMNRDGEVNAAEYCPIISSNEKRHFGKKSQKNQRSRTDIR